MLNKDQIVKARLDAETYELIKQRSAQTGEGLSKMIRRWVDSELAATVPQPFRVVDPGHVYELRQLGSLERQRRTYVKRSSGAIQHPNEHPGIQCQESFRADIDRCKYLLSIIDCVETHEAIYHLRMALFLFEARAYRRKREGVNRAQPEHDDSERPRPWRENPYADVPFNEHEIELRPIGPDGHIIIEPQGEAP